MTDREDTPPSAPGRWGQAMRGFCSQNVAIGCAFGSFGVTVLPMQERFALSRGLATLGLPLAVLAMGVASPAAAALMGRIGLRGTMLLGVLLSALGYVMLAFAPAFALVLVAWAVIGAGVAMFGSFPSSVLAGSWFRERPGFAVGFVNTPLFVALIPMAGLAMIARFGLSGFFLSLVALHALLAPLLFGVRDRPAAAPVRPDAAVVRPEPPEQGISARALLRQPLFWVIVIGAGTLSAIGISGSAHLFAFAREAGGSPSQAALVITLSGGGSMAGSLLIGLICDRIGAARSLALVAVGLAASWLALYLLPTVPLLIAAGLLIGICGASVFPSVNVLAAHLYGAAALPRVLGLYGLLTLPLTFCLPPLAGVLHDAAGGYPAVAAAVMAISAAVAILFYAAGRIAERRLAVRGLAAATV